MSLVTQLAGSARGIGARSILRLPRPVLRRLAGSPIVIDGRTLDPEMQVLLRVQRIEGPGVETMPIRKGRAKVVRYWMMEPLDGEFVPSDEVDEVRWLAPPEADRLLSYAHDRELLREVSG